MKRKLPGDLDQFLLRTPTGRPVGRVKSRKGRRIIDLLRKAQDEHCALCGEPFTKKCVVTLDHVFPKYYSFLHVGNLVASHEKCNNQKGSGDPKGCHLIWLQLANTRICSYRLGNENGPVTRSYKFEELPPDLLELTES